MRPSCAKSARSRLAVAAALAALGCSPTEPIDLLDARFVPDELVVRSGEASAGRVEVTNRGSGPVAVEVETCPPRIRLFDRRGALLGQPDVGCPLDLIAPVTIEPGETLTYVQGWLAADADGQPLPPGTYRVQAWVAAADGGSIIRTNRARIEVRAQQPAPTP